MRHATIKLSQRLEFSLEAVGATGSKTIRVRLNRLTAQALADHLHQYAGLMPGKSHRRDNVTFGAMLVEEPERKAEPVHLVAGAKRGKAATEPINHHARLAQQQQTLPQSAWDPSKPKW